MQQMDGIFFQITNGRRERPLIKKKKPLGTGRGFARPLIKYAARPLGNNFID